jgi:hypothetical protein
LVAIFAASAWLRGGGSAATSKMERNNIATLKNKGLLKGVRFMPAG